LAGIAPSTGFDWQQRGRSGHSRHPSARMYQEFSEALTRARAQDVARRVARIGQAAQGGAVVHETINKEPDVITEYPDGRVVKQTGR
jgi:hypothetical protein